MDWEYTLGENCYLDKLTSKNAIEAHEYEMVSRRMAAVEDTK